VSDMAKVGGVRFGLPQFISSALTEVLAKLKVEHFLVGLDVDQFAARAGYYLGEINAIHPFREGNGRTQREFIRQLALRCGFVIDWTGISKDENTAASILSHLRGDASGLVRIVRAATVGMAAEI
jgi:cell filamentation protein